MPGYKQHHNGLTLGSAYISSFSEVPVYGFIVLSHTFNLSRFIMDLGHKTVDFYSSDIYPYQGAYHPIVHTGEDVLRVVIGWVGGWGEINVLDDEYPQDRKFRGSKCLDEGGGLGPEAGWRWGWGWG